MPYNCIVLLLCLSVVCVIEGFAIFTMRKLMSMQYDVILSDKKYIAALEETIKAKGKVIEASKILIRFYESKENPS